MRRLYKEIWIWLPHRLPWGLCYRPLCLREGWRKRGAVLGCVLACYRADDGETHADTGADYTERQRPPVPGLCTAHDTMIK